MFFLEITKQEIKKLKILGNSVEFKKPFSFQLTSPKQSPDKKKFAEPFIYADSANLTCDSLGTLSPCGSQRKTSSTSQPPLPL